MTDTRDTRVICDRCDARAPMHPNTFLKGWRITPAHAYCPACARNIENEEKRR